MVQDDYGYIWIATWNGLSRFDGYEFYNYRTGNGSGIPHLHNRVATLAIDNQQNVWMRMYDGRIFVMRRSTDTIINPFEGVSGSEEFRTNHPLTVTSTGDVLAIIDGIGLYKFHMEAKGVKAQLILTGNMTVTSIAEGYQNDIWLGTNQGVHRMDLANQGVERKGMFTDEQITSLYSNGYNIYVGCQSGNIYSFAYGQQPQRIRTGQLPLNSIFVDSHGLVWFSDTRQGVVKLNPSTGQEKLFDQPITVPDYGGMGGMFNETGGVLWIRMNHGGYGYYNRQKDIVEHFHNDPVNPWNLSNTVNASLEMKEGVVWESTSRRGLEKLEILKNTIAHELLVPDKPQTPSNEIRAIYYDKERKLLLMGNKGSELYITRADSTTSVITTDDSGQPLGRIYGLSKDSKGNYWIASKERGIFRMTPSGAGNGYTVKNFIHSASNPYSLNNDNAYATLEDGNGNLWIATYGGGVNVMIKGKDGQPLFLHTQNSMKTYPHNSHRKVRTLALDNDGNVWAGTTDGILIMSLKNNVFSIKELQSSEEEPESILMSNDIVYIARGRQGDMWVGTNGGGLAHTIGKDSQGRWLFENFGAHDGLPSEEIVSITFDRRGNVWFATDHVICSFDTNKRIFSTFSSLDGVDETMCSEGAAIAMDNDIIIFGTINGYYVIDRNKLGGTVGSMLKLRITDFWLNDELQSPRRNKNYAYYVPDSRRVRLISHSDKIAFRFAALNYQLQHRVHYQYMLTGYDKTWRNATNSRIATYENLPTGHYRFEVKCFLLESPEKYDLRYIDVTVPPYFLFSRNAVWIYMLIGTILALWLMFRRQAQLARREQNRRLSEDNSQDAPASSEFIKQQQEWLDIHAANSNLTSDDMVQASGMTADEFTSLLRSATGLSPREYLNDYRMKKAVKLLIETNDSIAEVAYNTGFGDPTTFNRQFRIATGTSPSKYRDEHRQQQKPETDSYELIDE